MKLNIKEAAHFLEVSPPAIRVSIYQGRLKSSRDGVRHMIEKDDLIHYRENRWKRTKRYGKGELSPHMAADMLGVPVQRIYYLLRVGAIPFFRKGKQIITIKESFIEHMVEEKERASKKKRRAVY